MVAKHLERFWHKHFANIWQMFFFFKIFEEIGEIFVKTFTISKHLIPKYLILKCLLCIV